MGTRGMRVVDADGEFVGFVRRVVGQKLVIVRPEAPEIQVPLDRCRLFDEVVMLYLSGGEMARLSGAVPAEVHPIRSKIPKGKRLKLRWSGVGQGFDGEA